MATDDRFVERESYDALFQSLAAIGLQLECADASLSDREDTEQARLAVRRALDMSRGVLHESRGRYGRASLRASA